MGIADYVGKAKDLVSGNKDKVKDGIDKAADVVDEKTGGEHTEHIDMAAEKGKDIVDDLDE